MSGTEQWMMSVLSVVSHIAMQLSLACCALPGLGFLLMAATCAILKRYGFIEVASDGKSTAAARRVVLVRMRR